MEPFAYYVTELRLWEIMGERGYMCNENLLRNMQTDPYMLV